ncbi:MipA/OmpV family protein [Hylemonella gracilis]|uniref:MipA/OmpV family protein n=1 Tax=Hylemonella gracilis TaxID=80880 RepID=UPI0009E0A471
MRLFVSSPLLPLMLLGLGLAGHPTAQAENVYLLSLAGGVTPRYEGSRDYQPVVLPVIAAEFDNGVFLNPLEGLGYRTQFSHGVFASVALGYDDGRSDEDRYLLPGSDHLKGMGDVPGSTLVLLQIGVRLPGDLSLSATLDQPITETGRGWGGRVDLAGPVWSKPSNQISLTGSVHAGSDRYAQTFFGVTDRQAANSRFDAYTPRGGVDSLRLTIDWTHVFTPHWMVKTTGGVSRLVGDAADSPIVQSKENYLAMTALVYRF